MAHSILAAGLLRRIADVPVAYLLVWCGLVAASVALVVLTRSRWAQNRPIQKCAVLSLLVHLVFVCVAMTLRVMVGDGNGHGSGPPIKVRIIDDSAELATVPVTPESVEAVTPPELFEVTPPEPTAEPPDEPEAIVAATETMPANEVENAATDLAVNDADDAPPAEIADDNTAENSQIQSVRPESSATLAENPTESLPPNDAQTLTTPPVAPTSLASPTNPVGIVAAPAAYALRTAPNRLSWVESQGGNVRTEAAVAAALQWLASAQSADGHWDADRHGAGRELVVLGQNRHAAGRDADTGISALALLAFLGAGHTHQQGDHQDAVRRGLDFLIRSQAADGSIFGNAEFYAQMYCHSMATFALAEAAAMTRDMQLRPTVARAIGFCQRAQNSTTGGWRYRPGDTGDTSQLGWQMMALYSAQRAGISVPPHVWTGVERYLRSVRRGQHGGLASYRPDSPASTSMTAEALYCWLLLSETLGSRLEHAANGEATAHLLTALPDAKRVNLYYWYYATLALHHQQQLGDEAAAAWHSWNDALTAVLLSKQVASGPDAGSWNTDCLWGGYGGRVYTTAMSAMCLEVYYRYAPSQPGGAWIATHPDEHSVPSR